MKKLISKAVFFTLLSSRLLAQTEIFDAIRDNDTEKFMQLLQNPKNVNAKVEYQVAMLKYKDFTPLMCASLYEREEMVLELLRRKAKVNAKCKIIDGYKIDKCEAKVSNYTPLIIAASKGNENIVKLLLRAKADTQIKMKVKFRNDKCYKTRQGFYVVDMEFGPQGTAELFNHNDIAHLIRTAKSSKWIKEPIK